ncbi:MAG: cell division protein FtsA [Candidatus Colwellbacteria bacterium]|nr:cell division protein FtsA [Candidatus Colwellbacteria bacterium]
MAREQILGLDVGSNTIKASVAEGSKAHKINLLTAVVAPSRGLRRGVVVDMEEAASAVNAVLQDIKQASKSAVKNIYLNVGGADIRTQISRGVVAVSRASAEIYKDDVDRVVQASEAVNLPPNRTILHTITREYIVDGVGDIQEPLGMVGTRLEVNSFVIDGFQPAVKNLVKCVELAGGSVSGIIFSPLASALAVLTRNQKELGTVLIDIGYGTTGMAVYEENKLLQTKVLPVGAGHVTMDLAVALKIPVEVAEKVKVSYGYAVSKEVSNKESINLKKIDVNTQGAPSRRFVAEVIESRLSEICELVNNELRLLGKASKLPAGAVLVGGGAKMPGIVDLVKSELKLSTQVGLPSPAQFEAVIPETIEFLESPEYVTNLGLILWSEVLSPRRVLIGDNRLIGFLKNLLP